MSSTPDFSSDNESESAAMDISSVDSGSDSSAKAESPGESTPLRYCCRCNATYAGAGEGEGEKCPACAHDKCWYCEPYRRMVIWVREDGDETEEQ